MRGARRDVYVQSAQRVRFDSDVFRVDSIICAYFFPFRKAATNAERESGVFVNNAVFSSLRFALLFTIRRFRFLRSFIRVAWREITTLATLSHRNVVQFAGQQVCTDRRDRKTRFQKSCCVFLKSNL